MDEIAASETQPLSPNGISIVGKINGGSGGGGALLAPGEPNNNLEEVDVDISSLIQPTTTETENCRRDLNLNQCEQNSWSSRSWWCKLRQFLAVLAATAGSFGLGTVMGWPAPALDDLRVNKVFGTLETSQSSWIASLSLLGALFSCFVSTIFINRFGRKLTMLAISIPFVIGWLFIGLANNLTMIYIGRFVTGYAGGTFQLAVPIYVSEVCQDSMRGVLGSLMVLMMVIGMLFSFICGTFLPWDHLSLLCAIIPVISFFGLLFTPESPRFLYRKGSASVGKAKQALIWLRGGRNANIRDVTAELFQLKTAIDNEINSSNQNQTHLRILLQRPILRPMILCIVLMYFQQFGGINGIISYTVEIFRLTGAGDANLSSIILCSIQVIVVIISIALVDRLGRKWLLIGSATVMANSLIALGVFFYLKDVVYKETGLLECWPDIKWLAFASLITFVVAYSVGMGPVPWLVLTELLNPVRKDVTASIVTMSYWTLAFVSTKVFEDIGSIKAIGWHGCYWVFAANSLVGIAFIYFLIPETKGKTTAEIQRYFSSTSKNESSSRNLDKLNGNVNLMNGNGKLVV